MFDRATSRTDISLDISETPISCPLPSTHPFLYFSLAILAFWCTINLQYNNKQCNASGDTTIMAVPGYRNRKLYKNCFIFIRRDVKYKITRFLECTLSSGNKEFTAHAYFEQERVWSFEQVLSEHNWKCYKRQCAHTFLQAEGWLLHSFTHTKLYVMQ